MGEIIFRFMLIFAYAIIIYFLLAKQKTYKSYKLRVLVRSYYVLVFAILTDFLYWGIADLSLYGFINPDLDEFLLRPKVVLVEKLVFIVGAIVSGSMLYSRKIESLDEEIRNVVNMQKSELINNLITVGLIAITTDRKIDSFNKAAELFLGVTAVEASGKTIEEILLNPDTEALYNVLNHVLTNKTPVPKSEIRIRADEQARILRLEVIYAGVNNGMALAMFEDITAQKIIQKRIFISEKLKALGEMAAGVAHEIRNPITTVKGLSQLLYSKYNAQTLRGEEVEEYSELIVSELDRVNELITEFLLFATPQTPILIRSSVDEVLARIQPLLENSKLIQDIQLEWELHAEDCYTSLDENQMKQVLINLVSNAAESMDKGGKVRISTQCLESQHKVAICIEDRGCGISPEVMARIYEPFFTTKDTGTGLGLSIVVRIVEAHGGELNIDSTEGLGTVTTVCLPLAD